MVRLEYADRVGRVVLGVYGDWSDAMRHVANLMWTPEFITVRVRSGAVLVTVS